MKDVIECEKIGLTFAIEHIEHKLLNAQEQEDVYEHWSMKNIFLGNNSDYWTWDSESDEKEETPLPNIVQEEKIVSKS